MSVFSLAFPCWDSSFFNNEDYCQTFKESWECEKAADKCSNSLALHTHSLLQLSDLGPQQEVSHPGRVFGHKITHSACPCLPRCWKQQAGVALCPHPSPCLRYSFPRAAPWGSRTDTQTQWEPPTGNSNENMAVYSKRQTHLQRSSLSRKSDALLPSWRKLLSLLCRVTFTSVVLKKKEKKKREREKKRDKSPANPPFTELAPQLPFPSSGKLSFKRH